MSEYDQFAEKDTDGKLNYLFMTVKNIERNLAAIGREGGQNLKLTEGILDRIQKIEKLFQFPTPETPEQPEKTETQEVPIDVGPPIKNDLIDAGVDFELVDYLGGGLEVKPKKWLGDLWDGINQILRAWNYQWVSDGQNSSWRFQPSDEAAKPSEPTSTQPAVDVSEIEWMVGKGNDKRKAQPGDDEAWATVFRWDRDAGKVTDQPKNANKSLYDYLMNRQPYEDGVYRYSMRGSFFNRKKI